MSKVLKLGFWISLEIGNWKFGFTELKKYQNSVMIYFFYIIIGLIPSLAWLWFYLRKDPHPEPKKLIVQVFLIGMVAAAVAFTVERYFFLMFKELNSWTDYFFGVATFFLGIAFIEEYLKYFVVKIRMLNDPEFDEPVDAMIYMITAALGFAALENMFYIFGKPPGDAISIIIARFLSATVLHITSSGIVGYYLAQYHFAKRRFMVVQGIVLAAIFHMGYNLIIMPENFNLLPIGTNYFIIEEENKLFYVLALLLFLAMIISLDFKKLTNHK